MSFQSLGLSDALVRAVAEQGYTRPTPIQAWVRQKRSWLAL